MNTAEFNEILISHEKSMKVFALFLTRNSETAKDLVQETFLKAIQHKDKYTVNNNIKAWLFTILRNTHLNQVSKLSSRNKISDETESQLILKNVMNEIDYTESKLNIKNICNAINNLSNEYKVPFKMFLKGYKYKEIATYIGLPIGTVKSRIYIARHSLIESLQALR
ncbi:RNA polymerase sigma factor [Bacteroidales bacterium OttesenSCG-928-I21]|nr:RNA polymerase sigma factor [Bacteroidales bacterium OttesenSCG-928-I21]